MELKWKHRTTEEARNALQRFIERRPPIMTIPMDNERDADCILSDVIAERDALELQVEAMRKVIEAARAMDKHMKDRHELGTCCTDVTPSTAYLLHMALFGLDNTDKRKQGPQKQIRPEDAGAGCPMEGGRDLLGD